MSSAVETTSNPTQELRQYIDYTDAELEQEFLYYQEKERFRSLVRECYDEEVLADVRRRLWGTNYNELRLHAEVHRQKAERLTDEYTPEYEVQSFDTLTNEYPAFDEWRTVFESTTVAELKDLAVYIQAEEEIINCEKYRILQGMVFYKTGDEETFVDAYDLDNRGAGMSVDKQKDRLANTFEQLDPILGSLLFGFIRKITTNATDSSGSFGSAKNDGRWINIISDTRAGGVSTVAHEVGHSIQYAFGVNCNSNIDNRDADTDLMKDFSVEQTETEFAKQFQDEILYLWDEFIDGVVDEVRSYQNKNFNEFFACAFEYWANDKENVEYTAFFNKHVACNQTIY